MISRREFVTGSLAVALASRASGKPVRESEPLLVNDIHSQLNSTRVLEVVQPRSIEDVQNIVRSAKKNRRPISVAGGRHAMGGQQFGTDTILIDIRKLNKPLDLDRERGILTVESGIDRSLSRHTTRGRPAMGSCAEANRSRPPDHGRNYGGKRARTGFENETVHQQRRIVRSGGCGRGRAQVQPYREC